MDLKISEQDGVIIRRFSGEVYFADIIDSWNRLFDSYTDLEAYQGILSNYLEAELKLENENLNKVVDFLASHLDQLKNLKIAMVMDIPMVTNTIILGQRVKSLQIKPFSTDSAALQWIGA